MALAGQYLQKKNKIKAANDRNMSEKAAERIDCFVIEVENLRLNVRTRA
jgi:hypothetical protein